MIHTISEISAKLAQQSERVCLHLLPGGRRVKGEWLCGDTSGSHGDSLKVNLDGEHAGNWRDWADNGQRGDLIDLWKAAKGITTAESLRQSKEWLGIEIGVYTPSSRVYGQPSENGTKPLSSDGGAMKFLVGERKLEPSVIHRFAVEGVQEKRAIVFPSFSPDGKLVNRSYRTLPKEGEKKQVWQDKGCAPSLFGWHALRNGSRSILLCEGQIDAMTWHQWGIDALSIPNGSGQTWIEYEWDNLAAYDKIYVSFDMDGAGAENSEKAIQRLGKHRCFIVELPKKDANDCLRAGHTKDDAVSWIESAKAPNVKGLLLAKDLEKRLLRSLQPQPEHFTLPFFKLREGDGFYPRPCEVTIWTGQTSAGKSTFLRFLMLNITAFGLPIFVAGMESKAEHELRRMMFSFFNRTPTEQDAAEFLREVGHMIVFADIVGYIEREQLFEMMRFSQQRHGARHFLIDSLMRIDGLEEEFVEQGRFLNQLQEFAKETGSHIHLVAHPRKLAEDGKPGKMDVKGSSLIPNNADNIVAVCRNYDKDQKRKDGTLTAAENSAMFDTEIRIEKQRETGWEGRFLLKFDAPTFSFSAFSQLVTNPPKRDYHQ